MDTIEQIAYQSKTSVKDWKQIDGPATGVGVESWWRNKKEDLEAYVCDDQGDISIEISPIQK